jgi:hypothetical protein
MAAQTTAVYTFHKIREQCEQGDPGAWRAFVTFYTPLGMHLLKMYLPGDGPGPERVWEKTLAALAENSFERLRGTEKHSEREFLVDMRAVLLDQALAAAPAGDDSVSINLDSLSRLCDGLPLLHQEMLFHKLAGYTDESIERMLRMAPRVAREAFARLEPQYADALTPGTDRCLWPQQWLALLREARAGKQESCAQLPQFLRIHDGQVSWYDKEPIEKHVAGCRRCLEEWSALREVSYWRKAAPAIAADKLEQHTRVLPAVPPKKTFFQRMFR